MKKKVQLVFLNENTIMLSYDYSAPIEKLWNAVSQPEELSKWMMKTEMERSVGGHFNFEGGWTGWIGELKEQEHIQFNSSDESYTRFELKQGINDNVGLRLVDKLRQDLVAPSQEEIQNRQYGGMGTHWVGLLAGWHDFLLALEAYLAHEQIADYYDPLCKHYDEQLRNKYQGSLKKKKDHL